MENWRGGYTLEDHFYNILNNIEEFKELKKYKIKIENKRFSGFVGSVKSMENIPNFTFILGEYWGYISVEAPILLWALYPFTLNRIVIASFLLIVGFILFFTWKYGTLNKVIKNYKNHDFIVFSNKKSLPHELGHIYLHRKELLENPIDKKGFRNGLGFFFNYNVKLDIKVEELLDKYELRKYGRFNSLFLKYSDKIGDIYRFCGLI